MSTFEQVWIDLHGVTKGSDPQLAGRQKAFNRGLNIQTDLEMKSDRHPKDTFTKMKGQKRLIMCCFQETHCWLVNLEGAETFEFYDRVHSPWCELKSKFRISFPNHTVMD